MKNKKYLGLLVAVFLVSGAFGKYTQSTSLTSADVVYSTTVKDKKTGKKVTYQVQRMKNNQGYKITNTTTGESYTSKVDTGSNKAVQFKIPDQDISLRLQRSVYPWQYAELTLVESTTYEQVENTSIVQNVTVNQTASSSSSSQDASTEQKDTSQTSSSSSSTSQSESTTSSSNKSSTSAKASTKDSSDSKTETESKVPSLSDEEVDKITKHFGKWLYSSKYGQDAITVRSHLAPDHGAGSPTVLSVKTVDGPLLTTIGWYPGGHLADAQKLGGENLIEKKDQFDLTVLGNDLASNQAEDYTKNAVAFNIYTLIEKKHAYYADKNEEFTHIIANTVPKEQQIGAMDYGRYYVADKLTNKDVPTYSIILGSNGVVYFHTNKDSDDVYQKAPDDMQKEYARLLKEYQKLTSLDNVIEEQKESTSSSSSSTEVSSSSSSSTEVSSSSSSSTEVSSSSSTSSSQSSMTDKLSSSEISEIKELALNASVFGKYYLMNFGLDDPIYAYSDSEMLGIYKQDLPKIIDYYNTYDSGTYNEEDVLGELSNLENIEKNYTDLSLDELKALAKEKSSAHYLLFRGDNTLVYIMRAPMGMEAPSLVVSEPTEWRQEGDDIKVPVLSSATKETYKTISIKANDKSYTGGRNKTNYYVSQVN